MTDKKQSLTDKYNYKPLAVKKDLRDEIVQDAANHKMPVYKFIQHVYNFFKETKEK